MSRAPVSDYIFHIDQAANAAIGYVTGMSRDHFDADPKSQHAVVYNFLIIGEASAKLIRKFPDFAKAHPEIDWTKMIGMRNQLAHAYATIDYDVVWMSLTVHLPELLDKLPGLMAAAESVEIKKADQN